MMWLHFQSSLNIGEMKSEAGVNSQLSISRSDRQDSGVYKCVAENKFGKSEHTIFLAVQGNINTLLPLKNQFKINDINVLHPI